MKALFNKNLTGNLMPMCKKQAYLLAAGLFIVCIAHAQIKKGDVLLGGTVGFSTTTGSSPSAPSKSSQISFTISPSVGKAIKDDLLVGGSVLYGYYRNKNGNFNPATINTTSNYGLGVFVRKYKSLGAGFAVFAEGDLSGLYQTSNSYSDGGTKPPADKNYSINAGFYPGVAYFISKHVQLETGIQNLGYITYGHSKSGDGVNASKSNTFSVGTNLGQALNNFVVGVKWVI